MATQAGKIKREIAQAPRKAAPLARAEVLDKATRGRLEAELDAALKRKPASEAKLAGALRALAPMSQALRASMAEALGVMLRRGSYARELYAASIRCLAEAEDRQATSLLKLALAGEDAGGSAALTAACFCKDPSLATQLAKLAASRQSHLAFGAETARVARRESNGAHLASLAPMIKESHRISLCVEMFVPLARSAPVSVAIGPALTVLRGAERHLGRWLVLADVAVKAGDRTPLEEAMAKASVGPSSARAAWSLVAWALSETAASASSDGHAAQPGQAAQGVGAAKVAAPQTRPTVELVARLSDRPSADRDTTFLFRMARARAPVAKAMLETLAKAPLADEVAIRASLYLARDYGRDDLREALVFAASGAASRATGSGASPGGTSVSGAAVSGAAVSGTSASGTSASGTSASGTSASGASASGASASGGTGGKKDELRGLAAAALWDIGEHDKARALADELLESKVLGNVAWASLIRAAAMRAARAPGDTSPIEEVVAETPFRWIQWGWLE